MSGSTSVAGWLDGLVYGSLLSPRSGGGGGPTDSETVVAWVAEGPVPVTVTVEVPGGVEGEVATVSVDFLT